MVNVDFVMLTEYAADIKRRLLTHPLPWLTPSASGWRKTTKLSCVFPKTEKYAHVTFFFNGGVEIVRRRRSNFNHFTESGYPHLQSEMNPKELRKPVAAIKSDKCDTIICNYPNGDMVGHTGVMERRLKRLKHSITAWKKSRKRLSPSVDNR
ncbi:hypothetical protein ACNKHT_23765 [Shigella flexneri]